MKRTRLKNVFLNSPTAETRENYKKQRNLVVKLNKDAKKNHYKKLGTGNHSKTFWETCKPLFSNKNTSMSEKIILVDNNQIINHDLDIASIFNTYFNEITSSLEIPQWGSDYTINESIDLIDNYINKFDQKYLKNF